MQILFCMYVYSWLFFVLKANNVPYPRITTLTYLDKDQLGSYTMLSGDIVLFNLAIDRRSGAQRATNVQLYRLIEEQKDKSARETVSKGSLAANTKEYEP